MFERFTERARNVVVAAQDEARSLGHHNLGTEHLLLGLLDEEEGVAARVLASLDIRADEVRDQVARIVGSGEPVSTGQIPFTPRAKKVLELALREARSLTHDLIGTEHILLGLVRENDGVAARILVDFDADAEKVRNEIIRMLSGPGRRSSDPQRRPAEYSPEAAHILSSAREQARSHGRFRVSTKDLLLALAGADVVGELLEAAGFPLEDAPAAESFPGDPPAQRSRGTFTARAARVMNLAEQEAAVAAHPAVTATDILLGLLDETASPATRLLFGIGERADALRRAVLEAPREPGDPEAL